MQVSTSQPVAPNDLFDLRAYQGGSGCAVSIGLATRSVPDKINEDYCGVAVSPEGGAGDKSMMIVIADGVSAGGAGRLAAEAAARTLLTDYYDAAASDKPTALILEQLLRATNAWVFAHNRPSTSNEPMLSTVSALLLQGQRYQIGHVGDTRIYRVRGTPRREGSMNAGTFEQLTVDHTWPNRNMRRMLKRAIGLDIHLVVDFIDGDIEPGDAFLLVSDGVWDTLGEQRMKSIFKSATSPQCAADALVDAALKLQAGFLGRNDASAIVASVVSSPN